MKSKVIDSRNGEKWLRRRRVENVIIVGGGPAGYTAALYAARANLEPLVFEGFQWGGQLQNTTDVENYPGYPDGIMGPEMMNQFRAQAERFGTRFVTDDVDRVELSDGGVQSVFLGDEEHQRQDGDPGDGRRAQRLGIPGEMELGGRGVSTCGVCDGAFFKGQQGDRHRRRRLGDGGLDLHLQVRQRADRSSTAATSSAPRRSCSTGRASRTTSASRPRSSRRSSSPARTASSRSVRLRNAETGEQRGRSRPAAPSSRSATSRARSSSPARSTPTRTATSLTEAGSTRTNLDGVFAVGDLVDHTYRQAITAAGTGCMGALDAEWYLRDTPPSPEAHWLPEGEPVEVAPNPTA